jgi:RNA polymerase sigma-70 factor (ECF subfamily)
MAVAPEATRVVLAPQASETAEQLFQEHSGWIYGYCLRLLRSPEEAEDAVQTTYLNACRSLNQGTRPAVGSAWLLRIAQNVCFARMRSSGRRGRLERVQDITILEETVAAPERSPDALIGLTDALCSLPERQREAILLREWQGLSYHEVGTRLGLTQAAVETLIFRARRSLAGALEDPGKHGKRKALRALDVGGLAAAIKGLFAGSAGVKVAALAVAAATTATVVATDPAGVWRDRPVTESQRAAAAEQDVTPAASAPASVLSGPAAQIVAPAETELRPAAPDEEAEPGSKRGRALGQATAAAAKAKNDEKSKNAGGNEKGRALGHTKEPGKPAKEHTPPANGRSEAPAQSREGPPEHAPAKGQASKSS